MAADAWGTALFVLGPEAARQKARERDDLAVILVSPGRDGVDTVWVEGPVADRFHLLHDAERFFRVVRF
jgi:thiamine biosynthesis lipoprotein ApbE